MWVGMGSTPTRKKGRVISLVLCVMASILVSRTAAHKNVNDYTGRSSHNYYLEYKMEEFEDGFEDGLMRISGKTPPKDAASVIARAVLAGHPPKIRAIGASAVNQATKACAIARGYVAPRGLNLSYIIGFDDVQGTDGDPISAMSWTPVVS